MTLHQQKQRGAISKIEEQIKNNILNFSTVSPVLDYEKDTRICLTSVHLPDQVLIKKIQESFIEPLRKADPNFYYYSSASLHVTIKNIRVINDPPHFGKDDIKKVKKVFYEVVPKHKKFNIYFYRLLLFPNNLALMGTSDEGLDNIILNLDQKLKDAGFADDKIYSNKRYFFCNMTLARFSQPSNYFKHKVKELSRSLSFKPYLVDSVTLLTCNAVFKKRNILHTWYLK